MAKIDRFAAIPFRRDDLGNTVYYPFGVLRTGFLVEADAKKKQLLRFHRATQIFGFLYCLVILFSCASVAEIENYLFGKDFVAAHEGLLAFSYFGFCLGILFLIYFFSAKAITKGLPVSVMPRKNYRSRLEYVLSWSLSSLVIMEVLSLLVFAMALFAYLSEDWAQEEFGFVSGMGIGSLFFGVMIYIKIRYDQN